MVDVDARDNHRNHDECGIVQRPPALFADLYQLTMMQAYRAEGLTDTAVFSLFVRRLPPQRNFLLACGLDSVLDYLESLRFSSTDLEYLRSLGHFRPDFLAWLADLRFSGNVYAVPEGTPVFANQPVLEIEAPLPEAQLIETAVMNQVHLQTLMASKATRMVAAAKGRPVIDFGARRMHGFDAGIKAARAFHIAGLAATSNLAAGQRYNLPVAGTMGHSYIQAHDSEAEAFRAFAATYPDTVLLVDTYDSLDGVRRVVDLARSLGRDFRVRAVRLDSGDLRELAHGARAILDAANLRDVEVFASGGLDEHEIAGLLAGGAPVDGFGVGTSLGVSADVPALDIAYKLCSYAGRGRLKLSPGKPVLPGRKQIFRRYRNGQACGDTVAGAEETLTGQPLLQPVMRDGQRLEQGCRTLDQLRQQAATAIAALPPELRGLDTALRAYEVSISARLAQFRDEVTARVRAEQKTSE